MPEALLHTIRAGLAPSPADDPSARTIDGEGFSITLFASHRFIAIRPTGLWTLDQARTYRLRLRHVTGHMLRLGGYRGALLDASGYPEQPADVMELHAAAMKTARFIFDVKAAVYVPRPDMRRQIIDATVESSQRAFSGRADALDWLLG